MNNSEQVHIDQLINSDNLIFEENYVKAYYDSTLKVIGIVWDGVFTKDQYIEVFTRLLGYSRDHSTIGFYSDIRKQGVVSVEARKYFEEQISPKAQEIGINKTGVVSDASPFKKYYLNTVIKMTGRPTKICNNPDDALNYIIS